MGAKKRDILDIFFLVGSGLLITALLVGSYALRNEYNFPEFWIWGTWFGIVSFVSVAGFLHSKFRQRGFVLFCAVWFPIHMLVMFVAAALLPMVISVGPVTFELFVGLAAAYLLFGLPSRQRK